MYPHVGQLGRSLSPSPQVIKNDYSWIMPHLEAFGRVLVKALAVNADHWE